MKEYFTSFFRRRKYYFVSFSYEGKFGNVTILTTGSIKLNTLQSHIKEHIKANRIIVLYYKKISKKAFKNGTL